MDIALATLADLPELCELLELLFTQEAEFRPDRRLQTEGLRQIVGFPERGQILLMRREGRAIGMVSLLYTVSTALGGRVAILEDMVLHPDFRGQGLGSELLNAAIELARSTGCLRITLLTDGDNEVAQRFYARHGFTRSAMLPMRLVFPTSR